MKKVFSVGVILFGLIVVGSVGVWNGSYIESVGGMSHELVGEDRGRKVSSENDILTSVVDEGFGTAAHSKSEPSIAQAAENYLVVEDNSDVSEQESNPSINANAFAFPPETRDQIKLELEVVHKPLLEKLNLSYEDAYQLSELLTDQMILRLQHSIAVNYPGVTMGAVNAEGDLERLNTDDIDVETLIAEQGKIEDEVLALLSPEDYEQYHYFQETSPERSYVNFIDGKLGEEYLQLDDSQREFIIDEAYKLKDKYPLLAENGYESIEPGQNYYEEKMKAEAEYNLAVDDLLSSVLSEEQSSALARIREGYTQ